MFIFNWHPESNLVKDETITLNIDFDNGKKPIDNGKLYRIDDNNGADNSAKEELHRLFAEDELRDAILLIFANKQDLPNTY